MTYCLALRLRDGLVMLSDTRTHAGVDDIATFTKMHVVEVPGERVIALLTSGNLAVTQSVVHHVTEGFKSPSSGEIETLRKASSMFRAAELVGEAVREVYRTHGEAMEAQNISFDALFLLGGQIQNGPMQLFEVYAAGNFIEASEDTPFLQIGEHKYGKPILDRAARYAMEPYDAIMLTLVSMDATLRSNLTVGLPIDLLVYKKDALKVDIRRRLGEDDPYFRKIREDWSTALREAYLRMPRPDWAR